MELERENPVMARIGTRVGGPICRICLMEHDEEIHAATLSVREWLRDEVMLGLYYEGLLTEDVAEPVPA